MSVSVTLPALGESVTEGTVTRWLKQVGDEVQADEALLEVSTDKVDTEIPSPAAGVLLEIKVGEDETVEVGSELALIGDESESEAGGDGGGQQTQVEEAPLAEEQERVSQEQGYDSEPAGEAADTEPAREPEPAPAAEAGDTPSPPAADADGATTSVTLPALGESVTEGTVTRWLKQVGEEVSADEALLEVSTDKVDTEIPAPAAGTLLEIKVGEDETVQVGAELAVIGSGSAGGGSADGGGQAGADQGQPASRAEQPSEADQSGSDGTSPDSEPALVDTEPAVSTEAPRPAPAPTATAAPTPRAAQQEAPAPAAARTPGSGGDNSAYVTPLVRKLAAQHNVDLAGLTGTGVGGRIRKQDVLEAAEARKAAEAPPQPEAPQPAQQQAPQKAAPGADAAASPLRGTTEKMSRLRKVIAARMVESLQTSAQLTTVVEVDVTSVARLRDRAKEQFEQREGVKLSFLPFFARAAVDALKAYPKLNATIDTEKGEITYADSEDLGVAVDTERGLLVPVIKDAGDLSIPGLARKIADLAARTRDAKITPDELSGGTFTLTNTGSRGALFDTPIINQPQVGILGTGSVVKRAVVIDDEDLGETIAVRRMVYLALTYDHRLVDGADAARFLAAVKHRLEEADFEGELGL